MGDILQTVQQRAAESPGRLLFCFLDARGREIERYTRESFLERVRLIASHLAARPGVEAGDRVILAFPPGLEMVCAFFACAHAGLIPVPAAGPTGPTLQASLFRMAHIASDCQPVAVLTTVTVADLVRHDAAAFRSGLVRALPWIATDLLEAPSDRPWTPRHSADLFLQYTSGSTSQPKGVIVSHDNVLANARLTVDHPAAIGVSWLPQHHDMGLIGFYLNAAITGGTLYGFAPSAFIQRPALWLETVTRYRATATSAPNFALEHCLRRGPSSTNERDGLDLKSLKFLIAGAEPVRADIYRQFLQTFAPHGLNAHALIVAYGLAENTLAVSSYGRKALSVDRRALAAGRVKVTTSVAGVGAAAHLMSCGVPLGDNQVLIVDPHARRARPDGEIGEIWVTGASKCRGYWNRPEATTETFEARLAEDAAPAAAGRHLRTGDMGFLHEGELYVCGRRKDMIIVHGQNHYPQDIEAVAERACAAVRPGGLAAFDAGEAGEPSIVLVAEQRRPKAAPDASAIAAAVRDDLGVTLDRLVFVPAKALPKTSSGKIRRSAAMRMLADGQLRVLHEISWRRTHIDEASEADTQNPFRGLCARYRLSGDEAGTLADAGVDSLDLVAFLHELSEKLTAAGAGDLAERIDLRLVQERSIAELFGLARRLDVDRQAAIAQWRLIVSSHGEAGRIEDRETMRADRHLPFPVDSASHLPLVGPARRILLTGATGFLGPFLLTSLLDQTSATLHVLVRGASESEGAARVRAGLESIEPRSADFWNRFERRVVTHLGDLEEPGLGLDAHVWRQLAGEVDTIYHNGALVNYLLTYQRMRAANVLGTQEILRLAFESRRKVVNYISTTFIFGWTSRPVLREVEDNAEMAALDFGYSQSKWVAEQLVLAARRRGLPSRIFRPALITPSLQGRATSCDITLRLLAFMINHGIGVDAANQVSLLPADVTAANIVAIANRPATCGRTFHMTRDHHASMADVLSVVTRLSGRRFDCYGLKSFVSEVIGRCTRADPLYPLLDFLVASIDGLSSMELKRYDNAHYQSARELLSAARPEPSLDDTVGAIVRFLNAEGMIDLPIRNGCAIPSPSAAST